MVARDYKAESAKSAFIVKEAPPPSLWSALASVLADDIITILRPDDDSNIT